MAELKNNIVKLNRTSNETEKKYTTLVRYYYNTCQSLGHNNRVKHLINTKSNCHELKDFKCAI